MKKIGFYLLYGFVYALSLLPFRALYILSDFIYLIVYHLIRYRRKIVRRNLTTAFPEKGEAEIQRIEKEFYHWFCDYVFETFKLLSISHEGLLKHFEMRGLDVMEDAFDRGQDAAAILGHYCNWEWLSAVKLGWNHNDDAQVGLIYHRLRSYASDELFKRIRTAHKGTVVKKKHILRHLVDYRKRGIRTLFGYISDQTPKWENIHLWLPFLNHETPVFTGGERIMRKYDNAVFYVSMERPKRGRYIATFTLITDDPKSLPENEITKRFFALLEADIRKNPPFYLWTHNRWKRTKEEWEIRNEGRDER